LIEGIFFVHHFIGSIFCFILLLWLYEAIIEWCWSYVSIWTLSSSTWIHVKSLNSKSK